LIKKQVHTTKKGAVAKSIDFATALLTFESYYT